MACARFITKKRLRLLYLQKSRFFTALDAMPEETFLSSLWTIRKFLMWRLYRSLPTSLGLQFEYDEKYVEIQSEQEILYDIKYCGRKVFL